MRLADFSMSAVVAALLAVFVGFAGPLAIVFQAADLAALSQEATSSWIWAISTGSGVAGLLLSYRLKLPVIAAWSTPGAALLVVSLPAVGLHQAIGAYSAAALLILILGLSGSLNQLIERMPKGIVGAMLAGVLFHFGVQAFLSIETSPALVFSMLFAFLMAKRVAPRYSVAVAMLAGVGFVVVTSGTSSFENIELQLTSPVFITPEWSWHVVLSVGLPLALVTLTGQHLPGLAVLKASGYNPPARPIVSFTALVSLCFAPFGAHAINPSVVAASICTGSESNEDPAKRYVAGIAAGVIYLVVGMFGGTLAQLLTSLPKQLIAGMAGLALIGSISTGLVGLVSNEQHRDASVITFLVAASGLSFLGLSAAFWSLVLGGLAYILLHKQWRQTASSVVKTSG